MAVILLRLEMLSHGSVTTWNKGSSHEGEPDDRMVAMAAARPTFPHLSWRWLYDRQVNDLEREQVITEASEELESWTRRTLPRVEGKSLTEIIVEDGEGYDPRIVAQRFNVDAAFVRRTRLRAGRGTEDGREAQVESGDRPTRARELRKIGLTTRQIAQILTVSQGTVMRWTAKNAPAPT
jgi:DNA-directed RNA polymerase specialized sigma24 family protein